MTAKRTRIVAGTALVAASMLALTGCFGSLDGSDPNTESAEGTSFTAVQMNEITRVTGSQNPGSQLGMGLCEPLTGIEEDGTVFMRGAKSVESDDQKLWTITLEPGRTFSDGTEITAKTYVDTFNYIATGANGVPANYAYTQITGYNEINPAEGTAASGTELSGLKIVDDNTFTIDMITPNNDVPYMLSSLPFCPIPGDSLKDLAAYDKAPIGNGPYTLKSLDPQVEAVLVRDANYKGWVPEGAADTIMFRVYTDANTAYQDVVAGNVDVLRSLPPALTAQGQSTLGKDGLTPIERNTLETYVIWPTYLKDFPKEVRDAFSMIIDRDSISKDLFKGATMPARSLMPNSVAAYREDACGEVCAYDPDAAKALIEKSGFTGSIPLNYDSGNTTFASAALAISNAAKEIGLDVVPTPLPAADLGDRTNEYALDGPYLQLWGSSFPSASEWIASIFNDGNYRMQYENAEGLAAVTAAWGDGDEAAANAQWQKAEDLVFADGYIQPLYYQVMYIAHTKCMEPHAAGGDMQIYRTAVTCSE